MSTPRQTGHWGRVFGTLALAVGLTQLPWSGWALLVRPDFLMVAVLFWVLHRPERIGFGTAFCLGLLADFQDGVVFGQHAIAYVVAVYGVLFLRLRLLQFDPLRQAAQMFPVLLAAQLTVLLVGWLAVQPPGGLAILLPVLTSTLLWLVIAMWQRAWHGKGMRGAE